MGYFREIHGHPVYFPGIDPKQSGAQPQSLQSAMPGKGSWNGYGSAELIRWAGAQGLNAKEIRALTGRLNLNPAQNTIYIQMKKRDNLPQLSATHLAELHGHVAAVRGVQPPPQPKPPPPKPPEPAPVITPPPAPEPPEPEGSGSPKSGHEIVNYILKEHGDKIAELDAADERFERINLDYLYRRQGATYEKMTEAQRYRDTLHEEVTQAIHRSITLPVDQRAGITFYYEGNSPEIRTNSQIAGEFLGKVVHKSTTEGADVGPGGDFVGGIVEAAAGSRAFYSPGEEYLSLSPTSGVRTHVHEFGHLIENESPSAKRTIRDFYRERTQNEPTEFLNDLVDNGNYGADERAKGDGFLNPYMGKKYPNGDTELLSMGLEYLHSAPVKLLKHDPQMFAVVLDAIRGTKGSGAHFPKPRNPGKQKNSFSGFIPNP